jgi:hypothetical protein
MAPGAAEVVRRVSDSMHHALDAMHLAPHHHAPPPPPPACELAAAVLKKVKAELGPSFGPAEAAFCDEPCLQRYLRARGMDVARASAMLKAVRCFFFRVTTLLLLHERRAVVFCRSAR